MKNINSMGGKMLKIDLHVHSKYSDHPSEWFLQKLGASESYTEPEYIYKTALEKGMDFVTITDHNKIDGAVYLKNKYPDKCFISVEATVYFPEDNGKVHILIYDITEEQFAEIDILRKDIYKLREYIKENNLAYSVAHATYSVNGTLKPEHLEKLILLFDNFEIINGGRGELSNKSWENFLNALTEADIEKFREKYDIAPYSLDPWKKAYTGGSDDHAGIFIAKVFTTSQGDTIGDFFENLKNKKTMAFGRHNNYQGLTFSIYKIAYEYTKNNGYFSDHFIYQINEYIFGEKKLGLKNWLKINKMKKAKKKGKKIQGLIADLVEELQDERDIEKKLDIVYDKVSLITNEFVNLVAKAVGKDLKKGNLHNVIRDISSATMGFFLCSPFLSTFRLMFENRDILDRLIEDTGKLELKKNKKILWFTDTIGDLNGVSVTLKKMAEISKIKGRDLAVICSLTDKDKLSELPDNVINLDYISCVDLPYYEDYQMKILPILDTLKKVYEYNPDEIYISTPGSVGLMGLMFAKLLKIKATGIYHTDFTMQAKEIADNVSLMNMLEGYTKWFFGKMDTIKVPTSEYIDILSTRGFDREKLRIFPRGIETDVFGIADYRTEEDKIIFLYTGRISKDKNIDFLLELFVEMSKRHRDIEIKLAGKGPDLNELKKKFGGYKNIEFLGKIDYEKLPEVYQNSNVFLFPSVTDTFGMSVLEAQSCGIPAVVSDKGGPKEIILNGNTGFVAKALNEGDWESKIEFFIDMIKNYPEEYKTMRRNAAKMVENTFSWDKVMEDIFDR